MKPAKNRAINRRRSTNFKTPTMEDVDHSVGSVIRWARERAELDHGRTFATTKERDLITHVYLGRARDQIMDSLKDEP